MSTEHKIKLSERRETQLRKCLHKIRCKAFSLLVIDGEGPAHCGWCVSGLVVLGSIIKQAEQAMESKPVSSTTP